MTSNPDRSSDPAAEAALAPTPSFAEAFAAFARIGFLSFGGPAGQIALMHRVLVDEKKWLGERQYLTALNFCMLLPGPEAMQLATYAGWRLHGVAGGLMAGLLFVVPGAALILLLALLYLWYGATPLVATLFTGVKAAVVVIVVEALLRVAKRALKGRLDWAIAASAFVALFVFAVPFPLVIAAAGLIGYAAHADPGGAGAKVALPVTAPVAMGATLRTVLLWSAIWLVPLVAITLALGSGHVLSQLAWFFSKLAVVTFGGAYAVLAYMAQEVVQRFGWLTAGEMLDALGLAETTPGPLILVTELVGALAAGRAGGGVDAWMAVAGAAVTLWATFAPCFLWIFAGAPYIERLGAMPRLRAALAGVTAAVVGVILNLTVWFALHVLFARLVPVNAGPVRLSLPDITSLDVRTLALTAVAALMLLVWHRSLALTLAASAVLALLLAQV